MIRTSLRPVALFLAVSGMIFAQQPPTDPQQTPPPSNGGWRQPTGPAPVADPAQGPVVQVEQQQDSSLPVLRDAYGQTQQQQGAPPPAAAVPPPPPAYGLPAHVTMKPSTFINMRMNQGLASNKNQVGDAFSGTLIEPIVVDGIVVAQRGQLVYGKVAAVGKVNGEHRLGVELTGITLADGSQVAIHTQLVGQRGARMPGGEQAGIITTTTAGGAVVGAIAGGGLGAGIGAGAGAAAGIIGVLATKNRPSVIYPETLLTFQTQSAVAINTNNTAAFRYVGPEDYNRPATQMVQRGPARPGYAYGPGYGPGYYPPPYYGPYYYPYWGFGPTVVVGGGFRFGGFHRFR